MIAVPVPGIVRSPINIVHRAMLLAMAAHNRACQVRKNAARDPYFTHPIEVATLVAMSGGSEVEIAAAHLHDTVEDTDVTLDVIRIEFGNEVMKIVHGLTDPEEFKGLDTRVRKAKQAQRLRRKSSSV